MKRMARDENGFVQGLLMNPWVLLVIVIAAVIGMAMAGLMLLYAPNIMAALLIAGVAVYLLIRPPIPDPRFRIGLPIALIGLAVFIYFYGNELLAVIV